MNPRTWLLTHAWPKLAMNVLHNIDNVVIVMLLQNVQYEIDMQPALVSLQSRLYPKHITHRSINWAIYNSLWHDKRYKLNISATRTASHKILLNMHSADTDLKFGRKIRR